MATITTTEAGNFTPEHVTDYLLGDLLSVTGTEVVIEEVTQGWSAWAGHLTGNFSTNAAGDIVGRITGFTTNYSDQPRLIFTDLHLDAARLFTMIGNANIKAVSYTHLTLPTTSRV